MLTTRTLSLGSLLVLLFASAQGCSGGSEARESEWRAYRESADALSQRLWGRGLDEAAATEARATFDCVWTRIDAGGTDPIPDIRCAMAQRAAFIACLDAGGEIAECRTQSESACALTGAFREAGVACAASHVPRP